MFPTHFLYSNFKRVDLLCPTYLPNFPLISSLFFTSIVQEQPLGSLYLHLPSPLNRVTPTILHQIVTVLNKHCLLPPLPSFAWGALSLKTHVPMMLATPLPHLVSS
jgi:hypothetical protein